MARGDARAAIDGAPHRLAGRREVGGQEHFYLEGQVALAIPGEDDDMHVLSSNQHPSECQQHRRARARRAGQRGDGRGAAPRRRLRRQGDAGQPDRRLRRAGGAAHRAAGEAAARPRRRHDADRQAARFPSSTGRSASTATGGSRAIVFARWRAAAGRWTSRAAIADRAMFHADNAYSLPAVEITVLSLPDEHRLEHRLPRLRRAAGDGRHRGGDRPTSPHALGVDPLDVRKAQLLRARRTARASGC